MKKTKDYELLSKIGRSVVLPKHTTLPVDNVYYLLEGHCALIALTAQGKEHSVLHFKPGMLLNFLPAIMDLYFYHPFTRQRTIYCDRTPPFVITKTRCLFYVVSDETFVQAATDNPRAAALLTNALTENCLNLIAHLVNMTSLPADARVCELIQSYDTGDPSYKLPLYLTHAEIAHYLGLHVITVTKIFRALREQNVLRKDKRSYVITDKVRLRMIITRKEILEY